MSRAQKCMEIIFLTSEIVMDRTGRGSPHKADGPVKMIINSSEIR